MQVKTEVRPHMLAETVGFSGKCPGQSPQRFVEINSELQGEDLKIQCRKPMNSEQLSFCEFLLDKRHQNAPCFVLHFRTTGKLHLLKIKSSEKVGAVSRNLSEPVAKQDMTPDLASCRTTSGLGTNRKWLERHQHQRQYFTTSLSLWLYQC